MIPPYHLERLESAILIARRILPDDHEESPEVARQVEEHRWAWKPARVKHLLIAESHVYTTADDSCRRIDGTLLPSVARNCPASYVRLIYCLGYGETGLLLPDDSTTAFKNSGTPQFWKLFAHLAGAEPASVMKSGTSLQSRIAAKVDVLTALQDRGIWLLDASVHAIYKPGGTTLPWQVRQELHRSWWLEYGRHLVEACQPQSVWAIGKGVFHALREAEARVDDFIYQPQAKLPAAMHNERLEMLLAAVQQRF